ncbi:MAG TPA: rhomboid family intramembrane serine protease [Tepidisphaeraceae bacterium]|jgi:membrane associated rhomboid family serine protease|nr:rhomboid family intramembrane serine protease [Tepidisphaeraceae bacterium]
MFLPIRTDSPLRYTPYMNWAIIALNIVAYVLQQQLGYGRWGAYMIWPTNPEVPSFVSYAFMHDGFMHLFGNMLFLYIFGNNVNDKMGHVGYLGFYLSAAVVSGIGHMMTSMAPVLGASGAVSAVTGAYLVLFPRSSITIIYFFFLIGSIEIPSMYFILLYFLKDLVGFSGMTGNVAYGAHIAGTIFGFLLCLGLLAVHLLPRDQFDVLALFGRWNKRRQYRDMVSQGFDPFAPTTKVDPRKPAAPPDPRTLRIAELRAEAANAISKHDLPTAAKIYLELKNLDETQVLARQAQLDVANQLASQQLFTEAADAYERFLKAYPNFEQIEQVELMLGLVYARYLNRYDQAKLHLVRAIARLHGERQLAMAKGELARIEPLIRVIGAR